MEKSNTATGAKKPDSIKEALKILDNALAAKTATLEEIIGEDFKNIQSAIGPKSEMTTDRSMANEVGKSATLIFDALERGRRIAVDLAKEVDSQLRSNPWLAIGGVAIGTLALGYVLGRGETPATNAVGDGS